MLSEADGDDIFHMIEVIISSTPTSVGDSGDLPRKFVLQQNYPNPFNPVTTIRFSLSEKEKVSLKVFDVQGKEVVTLLEGELSAGDHSVVFDARKLSTGVYLYRLTAGQFIQTRKTLLIK